MATAKPVKKGKKLGAVKPLTRVNTLKNVRPLMKIASPKHLGIMRAPKKIF
jgi:hypothetical protein